MDMKRWYKFLGAYLLFQRNRDVLADCIALYVLYRYVLVQGLLVVLRYPTLDPNGRNTYKHFIRDLIKLVIG